MSARSVEDAEWTDVTNMTNMTAKEEGGREIQGGAEKIQEDAEEVKEGEDVGDVGDGHFHLDFIAKYSADSYEQSTMLDWRAISKLRRDHLTHKHVEQVVIKEYGPATHTEHVNDFPSTATIPTYPAPKWLGRLGRDMRHCQSSEGAMYFATRGPQDKHMHFFVEEEGIMRGDKRRSLYIQFEDGTLFLAVEYAKRYIVVVINKFTYLYTNEYRVATPMNLGPRDLPCFFVSGGSSNLRRYVQTECEHYIALFTCSMFPCYSGDYYNNRLYQSSSCIYMLALCACSFGMIDRINF